MYYLSSNMSDRVRFDEGCKQLAQDDTATLDDDDIKYVIESGIDKIVDTGTRNIYNRGA